MRNLCVVIILPFIIATTSSRSLPPNYTELHIYSFIWQSKVMYNLSKNDIIESCVGGKESMRKAGVAFDSVFISDLPLFLNIADLVKKDDSKADANSNELDIRLVCFISNPNSSIVDTLSFSANGYMMFNSKIFKINKQYIQLLLKYLPTVHQKSIIGSGILE